jgi:hypothetical protein
LYHQNKRLKKIPTVDQQNLCHLYLIDHIKRGFGVLGIVMTDTNNRYATVSATFAGSGEFEILAITAGIGNGWEFPASVLKEFAPLLNKVHGDLLSYSAARGHSVKDLAGVIHSPAWDESTQGIRALLPPTGPGANASITLGRCGPGPA